MKKSWKTTVSGIVLGLSLILPQLVNQYDGKPETVFDSAQFFAGLAAMAGAMGLGFFARDNNKTSESVGAKMILICLIPFGLLSGCVSSNVDVLRTQFSPDGQKMVTTQWKGNYNRLGDQKLNGFGVDVDPNGRASIDLESQESAGDIGQNVTAAIQRAFELGIKMASTGAAPQ